MDSHLHYLLPENVKKWGFNEIKVFLNNNGFRCPKFLEIVQNPRSRQPAWRWLLKISDSELRELQIESDEDGSAVTNLRSKIEKLRDYARQQLSVNESIACSSCKEKGHRSRNILCRLYILEKGQHLEKQESPRKKRKIQEKVVVPEVEESETYTETLRAGVYTHQKNNDLKYFPYCAANGSMNCAIASILDLSPFYDAFLIDQANREMDLSGRLDEVRSTVHLIRRARGANEPVSDIDLEFIFRAICSGNDHMNLIEGFNIWNIRRIRPEKMHATCSGCTLTPCMAMNESLDNMKVSEYHYSGRNHVLLREKYDSMQKSRNSEVFMPCVGFALYCLNMGGKVLEFGGDREETSIASVESPQPEMPEPPEPNSAERIRSFAETLLKSVIQE